MTYIFFMLVLSFYCIPMFSMEDKKLDLLIAIEEEDNTTAFSILMEHPDWINIQGERNRTPLHCAAAVGNIEMIEYLHNRKANLNAQGTFGHTPLTLAIGFDEPKAAETLISLGANVNTRDYMERTPLHHAAEKGFNTIVSLLLKKNAHIEAVDDGNDTPIQLAHRRGLHNTVSLFVKNGATQPQRRHLYENAISLLNESKD